MASINAFFDELQFGRLEKPIKVHLQNVYSAMGVALLSCAIGGYVHLFTNFVGEGILTILGAFALLIALILVPATAENLKLRFGLLAGFAFLSGVNMGPLLQLAIAVDPSLITTAFMATSLIFICFSLSALLSNDRKFLALGGILFSGLSWLIMFGLLNIFFQSQLLFQLRLYLGLAVMCGFVLYDTQLIVEKRRRGDDDYIMHCMLIFIDFINIFRLILVLLTDKEMKKEKRRSN